ncbi:hypothetical protein FKM82_024357, partial [Ascaphus truei]
MRSLLQVLCVLSALVATGYSIACKQCVDTHNEKCAASYKKCPLNNVCMASYIENTAAGKVETVSIRSCAPRSKCGMSGSISNHAFKSKISITCCYINSCTPLIPTLPDDNNQKNGVTCPSCTSEDSDNCYTSETIECTGDEKKCVLKTTNMT